MAVQFLWDFLCGLRFIRQIFLRFFISGTEPVSSSEIRSKWCVYTRIASIYIARRIRTISIISIVLIEFIHTIDLLVIVFRQPGCITIVRHTREHITASIALIVDLAIQRILILRSILFRPRSHIDHIIVFFLIRLSIYHAGEVYRNLVLFFRTGLSQISSPPLFQRIFHLNLHYPRHIFIAVVRIRLFYTRIIIIRENRILGNLRCLVQFCRMTIFI